MKRNVALLALCLCNVLTVGPADARDSESASQRPHTLRPYTQASAAQSTATEESSTQEVWLKLKGKQSALGAEGDDLDRFGEIVVATESQIFAAIPNDSTPSSWCEGSVQVLERQEGSFQPLQKIVAPEQSNLCGFGAALAVDGDTLAVAEGISPDADKLGGREGQVFLFNRVNNNWTYTGTITPPRRDSIGTFGKSISLSGDLLVVGSYWHINAQLNDAEGIAFVYRRNQGIWQLESEITTPDGDALDQFAYTVRTDGDFIFIGSPRYTPEGLTTTGAVYEYVRAGSNWVFARKITNGAQSPSKNFGAIIEKSSDSLFIGANYSSDITELAFNGQEWITSAKIPVRASINYSLGQSFAVRDDIAVVGAHGQWDETQPFGNGGALVYRKAAGQWILRKSIPAATQDTNMGIISDLTGTDVAISGDTVLIGAPRFYEPVPVREERGRLRVFVPQNSDYTELPYLSNGVGLGYARFGEHVDIDGERLVITMRGYFSDNSRSLGSAYLFTKKGSVWLPESIITSTETSIKEYFGRGARISGNTVCVLSLGDVSNIEEHEESIYIYQIDDNIIHQVARFPIGAPSYIPSRSFFDIDNNTIMTEVTDGQIDNRTHAIAVLTRINGVWQRTQTLDLPISQPNSITTIRIAGHTAAIQFGGHHYVYENNGVNWLPSAPDSYPQGEAILSKDGQKMAIREADGFHLYGRTPDGWQLSGVIPPLSSDYGVAESIQRTTFHGDDYVISYWVGNPSSSRYYPSLEFYRLIDGQWRHRKSLPLRSDPLARPFESIASDGTHILVGSPDSWGEGIHANNEEGAAYLLTGAPLFNDGMEALSP